MPQPAFIPWHGFQEIPPDQMQQQARAFYDQMQGRRCIRSFSERPVARDIIESCIGTAGTAPSGANKQPWHFVIVTDPNRKQEIRTAAEQQERQFYKKIQDTQWADALKPLGTGIEKPFLTQAPYVVVIFAQRFQKDPEGNIDKHYYVTESVGIAVGFFQAALHQAGLASLVYTPAPMGFLNDLLDRPSNERAFCICPVGYPTADAQVPNQSRKSIEQTVTWY
jgi:iodotyrosine deiodinase